MNTKTRRWLAIAIAGIAMLNMLVCGIDDVTMDRAWMTATVEAAQTTGGW